MVTFKTLPKTQLRSGAHYTEMEAFQKKLAAAAFTPAKLTAAIEKFTAALADEDKYLKQSTASTISKQLADTDTERDRAYQLVKQTIELWAAASFDPQSTAAQALKPLIDLYKINIHDQYDQETGLLTNIITDMEQTDNAAHIATLGLTDVLARLKELNEQMKTLMASRSDERSTKVTGALKQARATVNDLYDQITKLIESYADTADDATPYETFIAEWNAEIVRIRQQIGLKASSTASTSSTTDTDTTASSSGSGSTESSGGTSSGSGSGSSSTGDSGDSTDL